MLTYGTIYRRNDKHQPETTRKFVESEFSNQRQ